MIYIIIGEGRLINKVNAGIRMIFPVFLINNKVCFIVNYTYKSIISESGKTIDYQKK